MAVKKGHKLEGMDIFGRLIETTSKLPSPVAYGCAITIALLVFVLLGGLVEGDLLWVLAAVILASLAAFVWMDWKSRTARAPSWGTVAKATTTAPGLVTGEAAAPKAKSRIKLTQFEPAAENKIMVDSAECYITIGRNPKSTLNFSTDSSKISWDHGVIYLIQNNFYYRHLSKTEVTTIQNQGEPLQICEPNHDQDYLLRNPSVLTIGDYKFSVNFDIYGLDTAVYDRTIDM